MGPESIKLSEMTQRKINATISLTQYVESKDQNNQNKTETDADTEQTGGRQRDSGGPDDSGRGWEHNFPAAK